MFRAKWLTNLFLYFFSSTSNLSSTKEYMNTIFHKRVFYLQLPVSVNYNEIK